MKEADRSTELRRFFARYVTTLGRVKDPRIERAFAAVPREIFAGPGPWSVHVLGSDYIDTATDDIAFLYQDTLVALDPVRGINIGMPSAHASWLGGAEVREGETILQVGAGTGYYTAILSHLVGPNGRVLAYEILPELASRARENLKGFANVQIFSQTGAAGDLPKADVVYVCAGVTHPPSAWLDALNVGGRLVFPLQPIKGVGGMLRIERPESGVVWPARFISRAAFISCEAPQDDGLNATLAAAFDRGDAASVRSFHREGPPDETCWFAFEGGWLSTDAAA